MKVSGKILHVHWVFCNGPSKDRAKGQKLKGGSTRDSSGVEEICGE